TKKEKRLGINPIELLQARARAAELAAGWLKEGKDLAAGFSAWCTTTDSGHTITGHDLVADARRVCGSAMTNQSEIHPDLSDAEIAEIAAKPTGTDVAKEFRFWSIVEDGIVAHRDADLAGRDAPE